jgi:hypothetical protein
VRRQRPADLGGWAVPDPFLKGGTHGISDTVLAKLVAQIRALEHEIAARTEQFWCPIKHSRSIPAPHSRYHRFVDFGDAEGYRQRQDSLRATAGKGGED